MPDDRRVNDIAYFACLILEQGALSGKYGMRRITQGIKYILEYLSCLLPSGFEISSNDIHFSSAQFRYLVYHVWNS